jgi:NYN domain
MRDAIRVVQSGGRRLKVFVDFWNVVITARKQCKLFEVEVLWDALAAHILDATQLGYGDETTGEIAGCYIFGSRSVSDAKEQSFINRILDNFAEKPGLYFDFKQRIKKETVDKCPECKVQMPRTSEMGVDLLLAVEMIKHAAMKEHEYLAIVSSDRDFIPLLSYMKDQGHRLLHVAADEPHREMRAISWKQLGLTDHYPTICRIQHEDYIIFTTPQFAHCVIEAKAILNELKMSYKVIDVTEKSEIPDKDLAFLLKNQRINFRTSRNNNLQSPEHFGNLYELREALKTGEITGRFPFTMFNGTLESYHNGSRWYRDGVGMQQQWTTSNARSGHRQ